MQINPINNTQTFKACYRVPYSKEGHNVLQEALKYEKSRQCIPIYSKAGRSAKDISIFLHPFPYEHSYGEALTSALFSNHDITEKEAEEFGIKFNIFKHAKVSLEKWCEILNYRLGKARSKGIDVDFIGRTDYIYVTTDEDTSVLQKYMFAKIEDYLTRTLGKIEDRTDIFEVARVMLYFSPIPPYPNTKPKQNFIQRLFSRNDNKKNKQIDSLNHEYDELIRRSNNKVLNEEEVRNIEYKANQVQARLDELTEPEYIKRVRFLSEQFKQEKEKFDRHFFKNREITPVDSVEELIKTL